VKHPIAAIIAASVVLACGPASACTSFASYGDTTYFGMNFDYDTGFPLRLHVDRPAGEPIFHLGFMRDGRPIRTAGMNWHGLMSATQELYPVGPGTSSEGPDEVFIWRVYFHALGHCDRVERVVEFVDDRRLVQPHAGPNLHVIVADASGAAAVFEPGDDGNAITELKGGSIVMTNFCVADLAHSEPEEIDGVGVDRYVTARDYLEEHAPTLDLAGAFEVLELTSWSCTRASMVFAPDRGEVLVAFDREFDRIYRVSLEAGTVERHSGFDRPASWRIGPRGLAVAALDDPDPSLIERVKRWLGF
jgi:hypothetical protein